MSDDDVIEELIDGYRSDEDWEMTTVATKDREDAGIIIQHPIREEVEGDDGEAEVIETLGLSVTPANDAGVFSIQNTTSDSVAAQHFVAADVDLIDDLIAALEEVQERYE